MRDLYHNLVDTPLFGRYEDPFRDRRVPGPTRPEKPLDCVQPDLLGVFPEEKVTFVWLGHSSVFLHMHGLNLLIDPVFGKYTSPLPFMGPKRFEGRVPNKADFPEIDAVLLTHSHYDHLDLPTLRKLDGQVRQYIAPSGVGAILRKAGIAAGKITELGWFEETEIRGLRIALTPTQHGSARSPFDRNSTLWGSYILKDERHTVFDTGDGGFGAHFEEIRKRYGSPDLMIAECGQYNVRWHGVHMFPEESVEACRIMGAKCAVPVHWGAYVLSDHAWDESPRRFARQAEELGVPCRIPKLFERIETE